MPSTGTPDTDAAIQRSVEAQKANTLAQRTGEPGLGDYLNHELLTRQQSGQPTWEVGTIANPTYPNATDRVQIVGPNRIRIMSGVGGAYYTDPATGKPVQDPNYRGGSRDINTGKIDAFTYLNTMKGFAPTKEYHQTVLNASDRMRNEKILAEGGQLPDPGRIVAQGPGTQLVKDLTGNPAMDKNVNVENRYLEQHGVETPVELLSPEQRTRRGIIAPWSQPIQHIKDLWNQPATKAVRDFLTPGPELIKYASEQGLPPEYASGRAPATAPAAGSPAGPPPTNISPGLAAIPATDRGRFVEGGAPFNPTAPVQRAVPVGQSTQQAARIGPTNASERPETETTPMDINKTDLSSQPTPGITGGNQPTGPQGNTSLASAKPIKLFDDQRDPWSGF
jgi:hypothetical protein